MSMPAIRLKAVDPKQQAGFALSTYDGHGHYVVFRPSQVYVLQYFHEFNMDIYCPDSPGGRAGEWRDVPLAAKEDGDDN